MKRGTLRFERFTSNPASARPVLDLRLTASAKDVGADVIRRIAEALRSGTGDGIRVRRMGGGPSRNPTLVHHGIAQGAAWHVLSEHGAPFADLYFGNKVLARTVTQIIADHYGAPLVLAPNDSGGEYGRISEAESRRRSPLSQPGGPLESVRKRSNPSPGFGQVWARIGGGRSRVLSVAGARVQLLNLDSGNREWLTLTEFMATHRPPPNRNPKGRDYHRKAPAVGSYWQRQTYPQHLARVVFTKPAADGMPPVVALDIVTGRGVVMGTTSLPVNEFTNNYVPLEAGSPYRKTLPNPSRSRGARAERAKRSSLRRRLGRRTYRASLKALRRPASPGNAAQTLHYLEDSRRRARNPKRGAAPRLSPVSKGIAKLITALGFSAVADDIRSGRHTARESLQYLLSPKNSLLPESRKMILRATVDMLDREERGEPGGMTEADLAKLKVGARGQAAAERRKPNPKRPRGQAWHFDRFVVGMPAEAIADLSGPGAKDDAAEHWARLIARPAEATPNAVANELLMWGAWDAEELDDDAANWRRILWIAANNISEDETQGNPSRGLSPRKVRESRGKRRNPASDGFKVGDRVQLHAATDEWMQGDRYGVVVGLGRAREYTDRFSPGGTVRARPVRVKLDKSGRVRRFHPDNIFHIEDNPSGVRIVYNRLLGGWYVVRGPHQAPISGRFDSKLDAQAWLSGRNRPNPKRGRISTQADADALALEAFGPIGRAWATSGPVGDKLFHIGIELQHGRTAYGTGKTWSAAVAEARRKRFMSSRRRPNPSGRILSPGTRVSAVVYGEPREGTVVEQRSAGIVWVRWDGAARKSWMHLDSLTVTKPNPRRHVSRRNPRPFSGERERAEAMFEKWHEFPAETIKRVTVPSRQLPKYAVGLGKVVRIDYISNKWEGEPVTYTHSTKRPYPELVSDPDGRQLYLVGGRMKPTADGLVN